MQNKKKEKNKKQKAKAKAKTNNRNSRDKKRHGCKLRKIIKQSRRREKTRQLHKKKSNKIVV